LKDGKEINEYEGSEKLEGFRRELDLFIRPSFETISAFGANAAIVHYSPSPTKASIIKTDNIYLLDSGGQYKDGTTDITRTVHFGQPTDYQKRCFTRVLQGHIALDSLIFPEGVSGFRFDAVARAPLWQDGLDYNHGTGHGVGHALGVHEGPHGISYRFISLNDYGIKKNAVVTNEPGYYESGQFGIRIENMLVAKVVETMNKFNGKDYLGFDRFTTCPIQPSLINPSLMSQPEKDWINQYNKTCYEKLAPLLTHDDLALDYLKRNTVAI